ENASRIGPLSVSFIHSNSVPSTARRARVFFTTRRYTPALRASLRNPVISATVNPRYSAATALRESPATAFTSLTKSFLSSSLSAMNFSWTSLAYGHTKGKVPLCLPIPEADRQEPDRPGRTTVTSPESSDSGNTICVGCFPFGLLLRPAFRPGRLRSLTWTGEPARYPPGR